LPEIGPYELMLYAENGKFLLMLNEYDEDGDTNVRTISVDGVANELIPILGECYPAKAVTHNFQFVYSIFKEFAYRGDVSKEIMN